MVTELGNFCEKLSRGLESALEGDDGAEVERLAQEVRRVRRQRLRESHVFHIGCIKDSGKIVYI